MKKALYASLLAIIFFSSCQENEESEQIQDKEYTVSIMARIGKPVPDARYEQNNETVEARFTNKDEIGVFMDDADAVCWTFDGTAWSTSNSIFWEDKNSTHIFCAYYPFSSLAVEDKKRIKMPSLNDQDGSWKNIPKYDFLVASRNLSYTEDHGNVVFSGEHSFRHISSLLKINIKGEGEMEKAVIDEITLKGGGLITQTYYSFETNSVTADNTVTKETISIAPDHSMEGQDASFYFILNGTKADENADAKAVITNPVNLAIKYTNNNIKYIARRDGLSSGLLSGCIHEYNIQIKGGNVIITGGSVSGWTPGNEVEDIIINGEEVTSINE